MHPIFTAIALLAAAPAFAAAPQTVVLDVSLKVGEITSSKCRGIGPIQRPDSRDRTLTHVLQNLSRCIVASNRADRRGARFVISLPVGPRDISEIQPRSETA